MGECFWAAPPQAQLCFFHGGRFEALAMWCPLSIFHPPPHFPLIAPPLKSLPLLTFHRFNFHSLPATWTSYPHLPSALHTTKYLRSHHTYHLSTHSLHAPFATSLSRTPLLQLLLTVKLIPMTHFLPILCFHLAPLSPCEQAITTLTTFYSL